MAGMDLSLMPPNEAITREEIARSTCPICEHRYTGRTAVCDRCDNGDD